ncbi:MAG: hypothetical protein Fur0032_10270 [Terrimicrobiaceae bacterium]
MPEVRTTQQSGEMTQRFISFVMMHAQQAGLFLGQIPHPQTGRTETNLEAARIFIDQLEMIREKTRGNLTKEEEDILTGILSDLQLAFVRASSAPQGAPEAEASGQAGKDSAVEIPPGDPPAGASDDDNAPRKRFSKSYGS